MLYTTTDVARQLTAVAVAMLSTSAAHGGTNVEYCRGVIDTARAQALGYGIPWPAVEAELRAALGERGQVLELVASVV